MKKYSIWSDVCISNRFVFFLACIVGIISIFLVSFKDTYITYFDCIMLLFSFSLFCFSIDNKDTESDY